MILVVGATGGVGKRVVQLLIESGQAVRVLVRDLGRAQTLFREIFGGTLPDRLEFFCGGFNPEGKFDPSVDE